MRIGIAVHGSQSAHRSVIRGILNYSTEHQCHWAFPQESKHQPNLDRQVVHLDPANYDGIIGIFWHEQDVERLRKSGIHCVNVFAHLSSATIPSFASNDFEVGRWIGEHFMEESIDQAYFYGPCKQLTGVEQIGRRRLEGFSAACLAAGVPPPQALPFKTDLPNNSKTSPFRSALRILKSALREKKNKRLGLLVFSDSLINESVPTMVEAGIRIPEELIVASVDDDSIFCNMVRPSVSSVSQDSEKIGYLAAKALDDLFHGNPVPLDPVLIPPLQLSVRKSSAPFETNDPHVQAALSAIRERLGQRLTVEDLLRATRVSRRKLELAFKNTLGCSPYRAILKSRINHSKLLLKNSNKTVETVAIESGFLSLTRFSQAFVRSEGIPPGSWRKAHTQETARN